MYSIPSLRSSLVKPLTSIPILPFYTDGQVDSQLIVGDNLFVGGNFTTIGKYSDLKSDKFCIINSTDANSNYTSISRTLFNGEVTCTLISGSFIYVGGNFTQYNSQVCERLAKISLIDGSLDLSFNTTIGFNATVRSIALDSLGNLYVGGSFALYKGISRDYLAKLNATTAALDTTFTSVQFNNAVFSVIVDNANNVYCGGVFSSYRSVTRQRILKLNATTAALDTAFDTSSGFNATVRALVLDSSGNLYVGGFFDFYKGTASQRIAKLNSTTAALDTTFNTTTGFENAVYSVVLDNVNNLYAGGDFATYKGTARQRIAKLNSTTAALDTTFNSASGFDTTVFALTFDSFGNLYAAGNFTTYKGITRQRIAKINSTTAEHDTTFTPTTGFNSQVNSLSIDASGLLYSGGIFTNYKNTNNLKTRQRIAKISLTTGNLDLTFNTEIGFNSSVLSLISDNSGNLYAGGAFTTYKGTTRQYLAKLNATTAALDTTFSTLSGFNTSVRSLALDSNGNIYTGGSFTTYKGISRQRIAKIDPTTAALDTNFDSASGFSSDVYSIAMDTSNNLYVGGIFTTYKGITSQRIAKLNTTTAALDTTFDTVSGASGNVLAIILDTSGNLYAGGSFGLYKGITRQNIIKITTTTAALDTTFDTTSGITGTILALGFDSPGNLYACGNFTAYKGVTRQCIAKLNATTAALDTAFDSAVGFNNAVASIVFRSPGTLYVGGQFTSYKNLSFSRSAVTINSTTAAAEGY